MLISCVDAPWTVCDSSDARPSESPCLPVLPLEHFIQSRAGVAVALRRASTVIRGAVLSLGALSGALNAQIQAVVAVVFRHPLCRWQSPSTLRAELFLWAQVLEHILR